jgi:endonuclease G, mitochondrial
LIRFSLRKVSGGTNRLNFDNITISAYTTPPPPAGEHLTMGNPSNAVTNINQPANYLLDKSQYAVFYNRDLGRPNWVSWHLDSSWIGSTPRQDDFRNDTTLPSGWHQVKATDYSGSGFDRGHHCPSGDRTNTVASNSATFLMTNMMPQSPDNNQGPWEAGELLPDTGQPGQRTLHHRWRFRLRRDWLKRRDNLHGRGWARRCPVADLEGDYRAARSFR